MYVCVSPLGKWKVTKFKIHHLKEYDQGKYLCTFPNDSMPFNTVDYLSVCLDVTIIELIYYHYGCTRSKYVCTIIT